MKKQIENLYSLAFINEDTPSQFANKILELIGADEKKLTRSKLLSRSRWRYLTLVANILNDKGFTFDVEGLDMPIKWNKDLLYHMYWQVSRNQLFPAKKKQLNNKEFCQLTEHVQGLFALIFDIHINFPNIKDLIKPIEPK